MEEIGLTNMTTTPIILRMADQSRVKPLGIVRRVPTLIEGISFKISYINFKVSDSLSPYPILLGRPWLWKSKVGVKALLLLVSVLKKISCLCVQCIIMERPRKKIQM